MLRLCSAAVLAVGALASTVAPPSWAASQLDPAVIEARRQKSNPALNFLTYRHMDELFDTRGVPAGADTWRLSASPAQLPDTLSFVGEDGAKVDLSTFLVNGRVNALVVLKDGELVREIYRNGGGPQNRYAAYSMSKSIISMLVGIALQDGAIQSVDDPVTKYVPELAGSAYDGVTLRHILRMRSGTSWKEDYSPGSELDRLRDLSTNTEQAYYEDAARSLKRVATPGEAFNYSTLDTELLGVALSRAVGRPVADYMSDRLWKPAGMEAPALWVLQGPRGRQHEWYGAGFAATPRDFARVGQLMLDRGARNGRQVVPRDWADLSTRPVAGDTRYFYQWWAIPGVDGFAANGTFGQHIFVDRPSRTVVVMMRYGTQGAGPSQNAQPMFRAIVEHLSPPAIAK